MTAHIDASSPAHRATCKECKIVPTRHPPFLSGLNFLILKFLIQWSEKSLAFLSLLQLTSNYLAWRHVSHPARLCNLYCSADAKICIGQKTSIV